jgi:hypothetical protein
MTPGAAFILLLIIAIIIIAFGLAGAEVGVWK